MSIRVIGVTRAHFLRKAADYDSDWFAISQDATVTKTHNLNMPVFVYLLAGTTGSEATRDRSQQWYGGTRHVGGSHTGYHWYIPVADTTTIKVYRRWDDDIMINARVRMWEID